MPEIATVTDNLTLWAFPEEKLAQGFAEAAQEIGIQHIDGKGTTVAVWPPLLAASRLDALDTLARIWDGHRPDFGDLAVKSAEAAMRRTADETADWLDQAQEEYGTDAVPGVTPADIGYAGENPAEGPGAGRAMTPEEQQNQVELEQKQNRPDQKALEDEYSGSQYGTVEGKIRYFGRAIRIMRLDYVDRFQNYTSRRVEPYEIRYPWFWAYSLMEGDMSGGTTPGAGIRMFFMGRIVEVGPARGNFSPRWEIKL